MAEFALCRFRNGESPKTGKFQSALPNIYSLQIIFIASCFDTSARMTLNIPSIVAWSSKDEFNQLKSWFYDPQPSIIPGEPPLDLRQRAIHRVCPFEERNLLTGASVSNSFNQSSIGNCLDVTNNASSTYSSVISALSIPHKHDSCINSIRQ